MSPDSSPHVPETTRGIANCYTFSDSSSEYAQNVLNGLKSLGVETTPTLDRVLTDRYGRVSLRQDETFRVDGLAGDCGQFAPFEDGEEVYLENQILQANWVNDLAGVGYQFELVESGRLR